MANITLKKPIGVHYDVLVKTECFIFVAYFVIHDCEVDFEFLIILGIPFLSIRLTLVNMEKGQMKFFLIIEEVTFNICRFMKQSSDLKSVFFGLSH